MAARKTATRRRKARAADPEPVAALPVAAPLMIGEATMDQPNSPAPAPEPVTEVQIGEALAAAGVNDLPACARAWLYDRMGRFGLAAGTINLGGMRSAAPGASKGDGRALLAFDTLGAAAEALVDAARRAGATPEDPAPDIIPIGDTDESGQWHAYWRFGLYVDSRGREREGWHRHPHGTQEVGVARVDFNIGDRVRKHHPISACVAPPCDPSPGTVLTVMTSSCGPNSETKVEVKHDSGDVLVWRADALVKDIGGLVARDDETPPPPLDVGWILFLGPTDQAERVYQQLRADWTSFEMAGVGSGKLAFLKTDLDEWIVFRDAWERSGWIPGFHSSDLGEPAELGSRLNAEVMRANRVRAEVVSAAQGKHVAPGDLPPEQQRKGVDPARASPMLKFSERTDEWARDIPILNALTDPKQTPAEAGKRIIGTVAAAIALVGGVVFWASRRPAVVVNVRRDR